MATKICTKCGLLKDKEKDFSWSITGIKRQSQCRSCRAEERSERYEKNKEKELAYKWERQQRKREEARQYVTSYLSSHPCEHCSEKDPLVLTFHHLRDKKMDISQMVNQGYSIEAIQAEISKCIVLCSNCHLREEKKKRGTKYW